LELVRYIHLNPVCAGLMLNPFSGKYVKNGVLIRHPF
jgi:hypothetical protein